jgi:hypothetical protein
VHFLALEDWVLLSEKIITCNFVTHSFPNIEDFLANQVRLHELLQSTTASNSRGPYQLHSFALKQNYLYGLSRSIEPTTDLGRVVGFSLATAFDFQPDEK